MKKKIMIYFVLVVCLSSCDYSYPLLFHNNSKRYTRFYFGVGHPIYPDTILSYKEEFLIINMNEKSYLYDIDIPWNKVYKDFNTDTMSVFFFDADTLNKYSWKDICRDYKILKRYDLSLQDLKYLDYKIYYPPTPKMRDLKMYPPYGIDME